MSGRGHEILKEEEQIVSKAVKEPLLQQQEQILRDFQILWTPFSKSLPVLVQVREIFP